MNAFQLQIVIRHSEGLSDEAYKMFHKYAKNWNEIEIEVFKALIKQI